MSNHAPLPWKCEHTPGPWRAQDHKDESCEILAGTDPNAIAHVFATDLDECARADARLIAAAPELLQCLEYIRDNVCKSMQSHRMAGNHETARLMDMTLEAIDNSVTLTRPMGGKLIGAK